MDFFTFIGQEWLLVSLLLLLIYALAFSERLKGGRPITASEATKLLNSGDAVLVDLRDAKDYKEGHIAGSLHMPFANIAGRASELEKHKAKVIILADKIGQHAGKIGKILKGEGFQVRRLQGGVSEWGNQGLPLVKKK